MIIENGRHEFTVDNINYEITYLSGSRALDTFLSLSKIVGGPLSDLATNFLPEIIEQNEKKQGGALKVINLLKKLKLNNYVSKAVKELCSNIENKEAINIVNTLLSTVKRQDMLTRSLNLDAEFKGKILHLFKILSVAIQFNFNDVFSGGGDLGNTLNQVLTK